MVEGTEQNYAKAALIAEPSRAAGEVTVAASYLDEKASQLEKTVELLETRLSNVLRQSQLVDAAESRGIDSEEAVSDLGNYLNNTAFRIGRATARLNNITDRLEN